MNLVCPIANRDNRFSIRIHQDRRHKFSTSTAKKRNQPMLFDQSRAIPYRAMVPLHKHSDLWCGHQAGRGKRPRTDRQQSLCAARLRIPLQQRIHLGERQRWPVRTLQQALQPMCLWFIRRYDCPRNRNSSVAPVMYGQSSSPTKEIGRPKFRDGLSPSASADTKPHCFTGFGGPCKMEFNWIV
jgi:hypothetical protein